MRTPAVTAPHERHRRPGQVPKHRFARLIQQVGVQRAVDMAVKLGLRW